MNIISFVWEKIKIKGFAPPKLNGISGTRVGKKIYISGGCDFNAKECNKDTFIFNTKKNKWKKLSDKNAK